MFNTLGSCEGDQALRGEKKNTKENFKLTAGPAYISLALRLFAVSFLLRACLSTVTSYRS